MIKPHEVLLYRLCVSPSSRNSQPLPLLTLLLYFRRRFTCGYLHDRDVKTGLGIPKNETYSRSKASCIRQQELWVTWEILAEEVTREDAVTETKGEKLWESLWLDQESGQPQKADVWTQLFRDSASPIGNVEEEKSDQLPCRPVKLAILIPLLRRFGKAKALSEGRRVHNQISIYGYDRNIFVGNCLVQMYGNCGSVKDAQAAFDKISNPNLHSWTILINVYGQNDSLMDAARVFGKMPYRNVVSWTAMVSLFSLSGHGKEALDHFHRMQLEGVYPNKITFVCAIHACTSLSALGEGQKVHAAIFNTGYEQDVVVGTALLNMYGKCSSLDNARCVFEKMLHRNVVSWTAMIAASVQNGYGKGAIDLFHQMQSEGIKPNNVTFVCVLDACGAMAAMERGQEIHTAIVDSGCEHDVVVTTALINMYGKCKSLHHVRSVFGGMPHPGVSSWNALIGAFAKNGRASEALDFFYQMQSKEIERNNITYVSVLDACANLAALEDGRQIHAAILDSRYSGDTVVGNALVNMYGKCKCADDAMRVFERITHRDVISWNAMTAALAQSGHGKEALNLFHQMHIEGVKPDNITFISALDACASLQDLEEGQEIHAAVVESKYRQDVVVGTALISMYGKCGSLHNARKVFDRILHHDIVSWNAMIAALSQNGNGQEVLDVFQRMQLEAIKPTSITFNCVLTACSRTGLVDDGRQFFLSMASYYGMAHTIDHYSCMIDLLGRAGLLEEAENLINNMPVDLDAVIWLSLLGACRIHGDIQCGLRAANQCIELDPKSAPSYVMLSNIYAVAGR